MRLHNVVKQEQELIICPSVRVRPGMGAEYVLPVLLVNVGLNNV